MFRARYPPDGPTQSPVATASGVVSLSADISGSSSNAANMFFSSSSSDDCESDAEHVGLRDTRGEHDNEGQPGGYSDEFTRNYEESDQDKASGKEGNEGNEDKAGSNSVSPKPTQAATETRFRSFASALARTKTTFLLFRLTLMSRMRRSTVTYDGGGMN
ncbi:hypothetical protein PI124_g14126 [Phytophthora idaei]|nr:hypothetical protein PI125_g13819 [Phytophthora idaei]KAG3150980.1 hypothetical protein PI126_g11199 [Phytophthora idaei]KAG3240979.1 hypothetical protein PI124_g14126 [Phytophthora idaei]